LFSNFTFICDRAVGAGTELFNYYGTKPNWDMLTTYGFVSSKA
jgi:hypothetical protein